MLDVNFFVGLLLQKGYTRKTLANKLNIPYSTLMYRINNDKLYIKDVYRICRLLDLKFEEVFKNEYKGAMLNDNY